MNFDKEIDKKSDPYEFIDIIVFRAYVCGSMDQKMPIEWGRERMKVFMEKLKKLNP